MSSDNENQDSDLADAAGFRSTHWSIVLAAARRWSPDSSEALAALCGTYWEAVA